MSNSTPCSIHLSQSRPSPAHSGRRFAPCLPWGARHRLRGYSPGAEAQVRHEHRARPTEGPRHPHLRRRRLPGATRRDRIAHYLTEANLVGHDSHGVIRVPHLHRMAAGRQGAAPTSSSRSSSRTTRCRGRRPVRLRPGDRRAGHAAGHREGRRAHGVAVVALRNSGHLGRIGDWPRMAARAGKLSLHFVNTSGAGILVAPFGGIERRLSANPIAAGVPVKGGTPIILDMSTCSDRRGQTQGRPQQGRRRAGRLHHRRPGPADQRPEGLLRRPARAPSCPSAATRATAWASSPRCWPAP